jgi:iron complex outermembrane receptor protein
MVDPAKCPTLKVDPTKPGCESILPNIYTGGKQDLGPEKAKQASLGIVWSPSRSFVGNVDWWTINRTGTIQSLNLTQLLSNYELFKDRFIRDANGNLAFIDDRWINAGETVTSGVELGGRYNTKIGAGTVLAGMDISYLLTKKSRLLTGVPFGPSEIDMFTRSDDLGLRWKHTAFVTYSQGPWSTTLTQQFRTGYTDYVLPGVANGAVKPANWNPKVGDYTLYNLSVSYKGIKNLVLNAGIKNLLNEDPPFSAAYDSNTGAGSSWEPRVADPRGRSFTLGATYSFF